jgi:hypothetical protein
MSSPSTRPPLSVVVFTLGYIVLAAILAFLGGNREFVFYIIIMFVLFGAISAVNAKVGLSVGLLWCLSAWGFLHMAGGLVPIAEGLPVEGPNRVLYSLWLIPGYLKYDQLTHAYGFGVTTWLCWQALSSGLAKGGHGVVKATPGLLVLCTAAGMGLGALNEVVEFFATLGLPSTNVGGYENTGWDLVSNLVGCSLAALLIRCSSPK